MFVKRDSKTPFTTLCWFCLNICKMILSISLIAFSKHPLSILGRKSKLWHCAQSFIWKHSLLIFASARGQSEGWNCLIRCFVLLWVSKVLNRIKNVTSSFAWSWIFPGQWFRLKCNHAFLFVIAKWQKVELLWQRFGPFEKHFCRKSHARRFSFGSYETPTFIVCFLIVHFFATKNISHAGSIFKIYLEKRYFNQTFFQKFVREK